MNKPEQAHSGAKIDPVSCKHTLRVIQDTCYDFQAQKFIDPIQK